MLTAAGSSLVAGAAPNAMSKTRTVKVTRAFLIKGEPVKAGAQLEVDHVLAAELVHAQKAVFVPTVPAMPKSTTAPTAKPEK